MLKNKSKIVVLLIAIIMLISTISFATDNTAVNENARTAEPEATLTNEEAVPTNEAVENTTTEQTPEIYNGDLYLFDNNVVMDKLVDGNVFICGQNVEITGRVNGSLFVFGNKVTFGENSYVVQSIYACANELVLNGAANDLYATANKIDISYNSFIIRDLRVAAETFNFNGGVGRDAFVEANNFKFSTEADNSAIVYGNLTYSASTELSLNNELVQGTINYSKYQAESGEKTTGEIVIDKIISLCEALLYTAVVFLLAMFFAPKFLEKSKEFISKKSFAAFGVGLLACIVTVVVSFALLFSYIGVPLAFAIMALLVIMMSIGFAVTSTCITYKVAEKMKIEKKSLIWLTLAIVTIIIWALKQIPYIGWIVTIVATVLGFGIILLYLFTKNKKNNAVEAKE